MPASFPSIAVPNRVQVPAISREAWMRRYIDAGWEKRPRIGVTVTRAIDAFIESVYAAGVATRIKYFNPYVGPEPKIAPFLTVTGAWNAASAGGTAHTFAEDVGITASGAGWWDIGFSPVDVGTTLVALGGCVHNLKNGEVIMSPAAEELVGSASFQFTRWVGGNYAQCFITDESVTNSVGSIATSSWATAGYPNDSLYLLGQRTNATTLKLYDGEGNAISATTASCPATPSQAQHYYIFASNRLGTGAVRFSDRIHGSAYLALALTDAEAAALLAADAALQTALGR